MSVRHLQFSPARNKYKKIALVRLSGNHHRPELRAFHQPVIIPEIETARGIALAARLVARLALTFKNRRDVFAESQFRTLCASVTK